MFSDTETEYASAAIAHPMTAAVEHQDRVASVVEHFRLVQKLEAIRAQAMHRSSNPKRIFSSVLAIGFLDF